MVPLDVHCGTVQRQQRGAVRHNGLHAKLDWFDRILDRLERKPHTAGLPRKHLVGGREQRLLRESFENPDLDQVS